MSKIKKKWECSDGALFDKKANAETYEKILKIGKKQANKKETKCEYCHGSGKNPYYSPHVGGMGDRHCGDCNGTGIMPEKTSKSYHKDKYNSYIKECVEKILEQTRFNQSQISKFQKKLEEIRENCDHDYEEVSRIGPDIHYKCSICGKEVVK